MMDGKTNNVLTNLHHLSERYPKKKVLKIPALLVLLWLNSLFSLVLEASSATTSSAGAFNLLDVINNENLL